MLAAGLLRHGATALCNNTVQCTRQEAGRGAIHSRGNSWPDQQQMRSYVDRSWVGRSRWLGESVGGLVGDSGEARRVAGFALDPGGQGLVVERGIEVITADVAITPCAAC